MAWLPGNVVRSVVSIHETGNNPICCKTGWSNVGSKTRDIIHKNLSWKPYITSICGKVPKVIGILSRSRRYVPSVTLKALYNSLFLPYINYYNLIWASTIMPPTLNPSIYSKRKPFELSPFLLQELVLSLFSRSLIFFLSIHFINFMFLVLYSHTLITFYLPLFPPSSTLIVIFMII